MSEADYDVVVQVATRYRVRAVDADDARTMAHCYRMATATEITPEGDPEVLSVTEVRAEDSPM